MTSPATETPSETDEASGKRPIDFEAIYRAYFDFVWRSARRLGASEGSLDDIVQEVFLVVHRRLEAFERRSTLKTWIYGITRRVVADHRRKSERLASRHVDDPSEARCPEEGPDERLSRDEAAALVHRLLGALDDDRREVFVLVELEEMSVPEVAEATGAKLNTVYSRLRAARADFERALARHRAREERRRV